MNDDDTTRLQHILDAAREARLFIQGRKKSDLHDDRMLTLALMKEIEIIGEAAANISRETRTQLSQFEWDKIIGMRNILVHVYFKINLTILWDTVENNLPQLIDELEKIPELRHTKQL
jgi:uncharacterized protein with HEPN domain